MTSEILANKAAIIYGAAGSIGSAVARAFAHEGARLYLAGQTLSKVERLARELTAAGGAAKAAQVDARDEAAIERHVQEVAADAGGIDILFNAIGMEDIQGPPLIEMPFADFFRPISKAATTQFLTARAVGRHMAARRKGVMLTLTAGPPQATPSIGGFGPACHMIEGLWRGLAAELGPHGVRVLCLRSAGSPDSPDFQAMLQQHVDAGADGQQYLESLAGSCLLRRLPTTAEVASMAALMASDRASAVTGSFIHVTCGSRYE